MAFWNASATYDPSNQGRTAAEQQAFVAALTAQAAGKGPSAASMMLAQQAQQNAAAAQAQAAATRGVNPALAMRNAQIAGAQMQQQAGAQGAIQRTNEQLAAQGLIGNQLASMRGADVQNTMGAANLAGSLAQYNAGANTGVFGSALNAAGSVLPYAIGGLGLLGGGGSKTTSQQTGGQYSAADVGPPQPSIENGGLQGPADPGGGAAAQYAQGGEVRQKMAVGGATTPTSWVGLQNIANNAVPVFSKTTGPYNLQNDASIYAPLKPGAHMVNGDLVTANGVTLQPNQYQTSYWGTPNQGDLSAIAGAMPLAPNVVKLPAPTHATPVQYQANGGKVQGEPRSMAARHLAMAEGGKVPALVSPGERYLTPQAAKEVADGKKHAMSSGEKIPGKPKVPGAVNSYANDTVPKTLQSGGVVVPRKITQDPKAAKKADAFVKAVLSRKGK